MGPGPLGPRAHSGPGLTWALGPLGPAWALVPVGPWAHLGPGPIWAQGPLGPGPGPGPKLSLGQDWPRPGNKIYSISYILYHISYIISLVYGPGLIILNIISLAYGPGLIIFNIISLVYGPGFIVIFK